MWFNVMDGNKIVGQVWAANGDTAWWFAKIVHRKDTITLRQML